MELNNDFRVAVDRPTAWKALTDLERIAPLLPGAQLQEVEGDEYRGIVKVKVGPIQAQYKGTATLVEADEGAGRMVMKASGRDTRGQGNASATITVTVSEDGSSTLVNAATDVTISGKVAQFGRGVLADVSTKLIGQFAANLEKDLNASSSAAAGPDAAAGGTDGGSGADKAATNGAVTAPASEGEVGPGTTAPTTTEATTTSSRTPSSPSSSGPRRIDSPEPEPVDLFDAAGSPMVRRLLPLLAGVGLATVAFVLLRRRRQRSRAHKALHAVRSASLPSLDVDAGAALKKGRAAAGDLSHRAGDLSHRAGDLSHRAGGAASAAVTLTRKEARAAAKVAARQSARAAKVAAKEGRKAAKAAAEVAARQAAQARKEAAKRAAQASKEAAKQADKARKRAAKRAGKASKEAAKAAHKAAAKARTQAEKAASTARSVA